MGPESERVGGHRTSALGDGSEDRPVVEPLASCLGTSCQSAEVRRHARGNLKRAVPVKHVPFWQVARHTLLEAPDSRG